MSYQAALTDLPYVRTQYALRKNFTELLARDVARPEYTSTNSATAFARKEALRTSANTAFALPYDSRARGVPDRVVGFFTFPGKAAGEPTAKVVATFELPVRRIVMREASASTVATEQTTASIYARALVRTLSVLIESSQDERFEDGIDSNLSAGIRVLFQNYAGDFARVLDEQLKMHSVGPRILTEILHTLGSIEDSETKDWRFSTLVGYLRSPSVLARDAAAVALSYLDDVRAEPFLLAAIERESNVELREDLRSVVEQLGT